jgi:tetratricopeptide (TPR) repeat protein
VPDRSFLRGLLRGALLCCGLWAGCARPPELPLQVEYTGCAKVFLPGPVCVLRKSNLLGLWVHLPPEVPLEIRAGGRRLRSAPVAIQGGQRHVVEIPPATSPVVVRAATPQGEAVWSLAISPRREGPGDVASIQARIALKRGDDDTAQTFLTRAMAAHHAAGSLFAEVNDAAALVWIQIQRRQFAAARQILSGLELPPGSPADAAYFRSYYRGMLAGHTGDVRTALTELEAAIGQVERVDGVNLQFWDAEQLLGLQLQALGRSREAALLFDRLRRARPPKLKPCYWNEMLSNQAWSLLLAGEAGQRLGDPLPLLAEARRVAERAGCPRPDQRRLNDGLNLALAHLQAGRLPAARATLSETHALQSFSRPLQRLWALDLAARIDLAEGRPEAALHLYGRLEELASSVLAPDGRWRAAYGRARCYQALGRSKEALAALQQAEELLNAQSLEIPIQEGRETFAAQREGATKLYLELLLAAGRNAEALEVARHSRSRVLRQLARGDRLAHLNPQEQRQWDDALAEYWNRRASLDAGADDEWRLPADQLRRRQETLVARYQEAERALDRAFAVLGGPVEHAALPVPRPGEVVLAYHPLPRGWVGFAAEGRTVAVHRFELPESALSQPAELAARLLAPFQDRIDRARRLRILPYGILRAVDFHALPFRGDVLLATLPVTYGLDLSPPAQSRPAPERRALIVANPLEDLPDALREADAVAAALHPAWSTRILRGPEASAGEVRRSLAGADLLHYAGHGVFSGSGGWESVLPLAGGTRLTLGDLLAARRVPRWVVLSGCDTGRSADDAPAEGLGLAHAFLLAGAQEVIAATRPVGDRAARMLFTELYRRWSPAPDLAALLRDAQLVWRRVEPAGDWQSFRLFEP